MFGKLFSPPKIKSPTGFFIVEMDKLLPVNELPGNGSINDVILSLGYPINHVHTIFTFDAPEIGCLGVKIFTRKPVVVLLKDKNLELSKNDLDKTISKVDWNFEYASHEVEEILGSGIGQKNLSLEFLQSVLALVKEGESLYECRQFGLYLKFEDNLLKYFTSASQESTSTKWLKNLNP